MGLSRALKGSFLSLAMSFIVTGQCYAQGLRTGSEDVFTKPQGSGWTQILLGLVELGVASAVWPGMELEEKVLAKAESNLRWAHGLPTSEAQKSALIEAVMADEANYESNIHTGKFNDLDQDARVKLAHIKGLQVVDEAKKTATIAAHQKEVAEATEKALAAAQSRGFIHKSVRVLRAGTSIIIAGDVLARVYVWNSLEANPTFSPIASLGVQGVQNILNKK